MVKRVSRRLSVTGRVFITLTGSSSLGAVGPSTSKGPAAVPVLPPAVSFSAPRGRLRFYPGFSCQRVTCHVPGGPLPSAMLWALNPPVLSPPLKRSPASWDVAAGTPPRTRFQKKAMTVCHTSPSFPIPCPLPLQSPRFPAASAPDAEGFLRRCLGEPRG